VIDLVVVFALFMFALLCFCVAAVFSVNKDSYTTTRLQPGRLSVKRLQRYGDFTFLPRDAMHPRY